MLSDKRNEFGKKNIPHLITFEIASKYFIDLAEYGK